MNQSRKKFTTFFIVALICFSIATITITCINYFRISSDTVDFDDIAQNWQTGAIMDVTVVSQCPNGYDTAFSFTWPGTSAGCDCRGVSITTKYYYNIDCSLCSGSCSWNETLAGCDDIKSYPAVTMSNWGQVNYNNMKICVQRSQETWLQVAQQSGPDCNNNTSLKQCGFSPENIFCTSESSCPINNVQIVNLTLPAQVVQLANCTAQNNCTIVSETAYSAKVFYYQRGDTYDALPTAEMALNEYSMCMDMSEEDITPGRTDFYLLNDKRSTCYSEGAGMWNWTDSMTEAQLFSLNGMTNTINYLERFDYYSDGEDGSDYTYSVFSRSYIPWAIDCRGSMGALVQNTNTMNTLKSIQLALMILTIISGIALGIVVPLLMKDVYKGDENPSMMKWARNSSHIAKIPTLILQIAVIVISNNTKGFFENMMTQSCSTPLVMQTITNIANDLKLNYTCNAVNISLQCVIAIIGACYFHRRWDFTSSDSYRQPEQQALYDNKFSEVADVPPQYTQNQFVQNQYGNNGFTGANEDYAPPAEIYPPNNDDVPPPGNYGNNYYQTQQ